MSGDKFTVSTSVGGELPWPDSWKSFVNQRNPFLEHPAFWFCSEARYLLKLAASQNLSFPTGTEILSRGFGQLTGHGTFPPRGGF